MHRLLLLALGVGVELPDLVQEIGLVRLEGADLRVGAVVVHWFLPRMGRDEHPRLLLLLGESHLDEPMLLFCEGRSRDRGVVLLGTAIGEQKRWRDRLRLGLRLRILFDYFHVINILFYCWGQAAATARSSPKMPSMTAPSSIDISSHLINNLSY